MAGVMPPSCHVGPSASRTSACLPDGGRGRPLAYSDDRDHRPADRPVRTDHGQCRAARRYRGPAVRVRGVRPPAADRAPLRRGRRHRPACRGARRVPVRPGRGRVPARTGRGRRGRPPAWLADYRFARRHRRLPRGRAVLPRLADPDRLRQLRRVRGAGDAGAVGAQPRLRGRRRGRPDGDRGPGPAGDRDGLPAHPRARPPSPRPAPPTSPASRPPPTWRPAGATASRPPVPRRTPSRCCTTTSRPRSPRRSPRSASRPRCWSTPTTSPQGIRNAIEVAGPGPAGDPDRLRRPVGAGRTSPARCWTRSARPRRRSWSPATSTSTRSPRWPPSRSTSTAPAPPWSPAPAHPTAGLVYKLVEVDGRPVVKRSRAQGHRRRAQDRGTPAQADRYRDRGDRGVPGGTRLAGRRPAAAARLRARRRAGRRPAHPRRVPGAPAAGADLDTVGGAEALRRRPGHPGDRHRPRPA